MFFIGGETVGAVRRALARAYGRAFAMLVAALAVNSSLNIFIAPNRSVVSGLPGPLPYVWAVQYGMGGLMLAGGIMANRLNLEAAGCVAFVGGALVNTVAVMFGLGWHAWNVVLILVMFVAAATARLTALVQHRVLVLLPEPPEV